MPKSEHFEVLVGKSVTKAKATFIWSLNLKNLDSACHFHQRSQISFKSKDFKILTGNSVTMPIPVHIIAPKLTNFKCDTLFLKTQAYRN